MSQEKRPSKKTSHGLAGLREFPTINPNISRGFAKGQKVFHNRFILRREIGRGAMGVVWLAHDEVLAEDFAMKFLPDLVVSDMVALRELLNETRRCMTLTHHHIVKVFNLLSEQEEDLAAILMEYVDGPTMSVRRIEQPGEVFTAPALEPFLNQLCEALEYAHTKASIVHRDLKPSNLLVNSRNELKLADFGVARNLSDAMTRLTRGPMSASGTLPYMSLQQLMGKRPTPLDDIYGLGATVFELLTGTPPYYCGDISLQIQHVPASTVSERRAEFGIQSEPVPPRWEEVIAASLSKDPAKRPQSAREFFRQITDPTPVILAPVPETAAAEFERAAREVESALQAAELEQRATTVRTGVLSGRTELLARVDTALGTAQTRVKFLEPFPSRVTSVRTSRHVRDLEQELDSEASRLLLRPDTQARLKNLLLQAETRILSAEETLRSAAKSRLPAVRNAEELRAARAFLDDPDNRLLAEGNPLLAAELATLLRDAEQRLEAATRATGQFEQEALQAETPEQLQALGQRLAVLKSGELAARPELHAPLAAALAAAHERVGFVAQFVNWVERSQNHQQIVELERTLVEDADRLRLQPALVAKLRERWQAADHRVAVAENELLATVQAKAAQARTPEDFKNLRALLEQPQHQSLAGGNPGLTAELQRLIEDAEAREAEVRKLVETFERDAAAAETEAQGTDLAATLEAARTETLLGRDETVQRLAAALATAQERIAFFQQLGRLAEQPVNRRSLEEFGKQLEAGAARLKLERDSRRRWEEWRREALESLTAGEATLTDAARQRFAQARSEAELDAARAWLTKPEHQTLLEGNSALAADMARLVDEAAHRLAEAARNLEETRRRTEEEARRQAEQRKREAAAAAFMAEFERLAAAAEEAAQLKELERQLTEARAGALAGQPPERERQLGRLLDTARARADFIARFPERATNVLTVRAADDLRRDLDRESERLGLSQPTRGRLTGLLKSAHEKLKQAEQPVPVPWWKWAAAAGCVAILVAVAVMLAKQGDKIIIETGKIEIPPPPPGFGTLNLSSRQDGITMRPSRWPPGAEAILRTGSLPAVFTRLPAGSYKLEFSAPDHESLVAEFTVLRDATLTTNITLVRFTGSVSLQSTPPGASFELTPSQPGQLPIKGSTPTNLSVAVGSYQVKLSRPKHADFTTNLTVAAKTTRAVSAAFPEGQLSFAGGYRGSRYELIALHASLPPWMGVAGENLADLPVGTYRAVFHNTDTNFIDIVHERVVVASGKPSTLPPADWKLRTEPPKFGGILLTATPTAATAGLRVGNGTLTQPMPATFGNLLPGTHQVTVQAPGYVTITTNLTVTVGVTNPFSVTLKISPKPEGSVQLASTAKGMGFRLLAAKSGQEIPMAGTSSQSLEEGEYLAVFTRDWGSGFRTSVTNNVRVTGGSAANVQPVFEEARVSVTANPANASFRLFGNGAPASGVAVTDAAALALPPGTYQVVASLDGVPTKTRDITLRKGENPNVQFNFMGLAIIGSDPSGAQVRVDGKPTTGRPEAGLKLLEGPHRIDFTLDGYHPTNVSLTIKAEETNRTFASLRLTPLPPKFVGIPLNADRWTNSLDMQMARVFETGKRTVGGKQLLFSVYETRVKDFEAFVKDQNLTWSRVTAPPAGPQEADHPAVNISWQQAKDFCVWLTDRERAAGKLGPNQTYRLPTDAEWSAAVGLETEFGATPADKLTVAYDGYTYIKTPWGQYNKQTEFKPPVGVANYGVNLKADSFPGTSPVGKFKANSFGLHDTGGNAQEWTSDLFGKLERVWAARGGSWRTEAGRRPKYMEPFASAYRFPCSIGHDDNGFRAVLDLGN